MPFFRAFQHLLPDSQAWRLTTDKMLRKFFIGLSSAPADARAFVDLVYLDMFPDTTRELSAWERHHGIIPRALEADRRTTLAAAWAATGGQSPKYIQDTLQAYGFNVFIHEWWDINIGASVLDAGVTFDYSATEPTPHGIAFSNGGDLFYMAESTNGWITSHKLAVPWDISSVGPIEDLKLVAAEDAQPWDIVWNADGSSYYMVGVTTATVYQYDTLTPWALTGSGNVGSFAVGAQDATPLGLLFSPDGIRMLIVGFVGDSIHQYVLSTAWDVTTAALDVSVSVAATSIDPVSIAFEPGGSKIYVLNNVAGLGDSVRQYDLHQPYDITGMTYDSRALGVGVTDLNPSSIVMGRGGTRLYLMGASNSLVYQYVHARGAKDPRDHTTQPVKGLTQCGDDLAQCGEIPPLQEGVGSAVCGNQLANPDAIGYIVNLNLSQEAPPSVPDDSALWPGFLYLGAAAFPAKADIPIARRYEFEHMLQKLKPAQDWIVTLVNYV